MARRALVIGSQIDGLRGVENDAACMATSLDSRGFDVDLRIGGTATRAGIIAGYDRLIESSTATDAAVVYYSGHGVYQAVAAERRSWQCVVPTDYRQSSAADWRGITAWELSIKQSQLTEKTRNVTVILDCCHSSQMSRADAVARALPHPVHAGFERHLDVLRATYDTAFDNVHAVGNPHAIRLVACGQAESSYEYLTAHGDYRGAFTEALIDVLNQVGDAEVSWQAISDAVRIRVLARFVLQRPTVEGPARRRPFSLAEANTPSGVAIAASNNRFRLPVGHLAGVGCGDIYGVMSAGSVRHLDRGMLGELQVVEVFAMTAIAEQRTGHGVVPPGAVAFPIHRRAVKRAVAVEVSTEHSALVAHAVVACPALRVASTGEFPMATLRLTSEGLTVDDTWGPVCRPVQFPDELEVAVNTVVGLGVAQGLRELEGEHGVLASELDVELGIVKEGELRCIRDHGGALGLRDQFYVRMTTRSHRPLFVHAFNIAADGRIKLLTDFARTGSLLDRRTPSLVLGERADGSHVGITLTWPDTLPPDCPPRLEEIVVIATLTRTYLAGFDSGSTTVLRSHGTSLQSLLGALLRDGLPRGVISDSERDGFLVKRLSYVLYPCNAISEDLEAHRIPYDNEARPAGGSIDAR